MTRRMSPSVPIAREITIEVGYSNGLTLASILASSYNMSSCRKLAFRMIAPYANGSDVFPAYREQCKQEGLPLLGVCPPMHHSQHTSLFNPFHLQIIRKEDKFGAHNYSPLPCVLTKGERCFMWDTEGKR